MGGNDFGFGEQQQETNDDAGAGWDNVDLFGGNQQKVAHEFAKPPLVDVFQRTQAAQKGLVGVHIKGHFIY